MTSPQVRPTSIRVFLADGTPEGLRIVEKSNWTGRAVVANRSQLEGALKRSEMAQPGVYTALMLLSRTVAKRLHHHRLKTCPRFT